MRAALVANYLCVHYFSFARPFSSRQRAFTLVELLVVILIIGILIAVAAPSFLGQQTKANDSVIQQQLNTAYVAAKAEETDPDSSASNTQGQFATGSGLVAAIQASEPELNISATNTPAAGALGVCASSSPTTVQLIGRSASATDYVLTASDSGLNVTAGQCSAGAGSAASEQQSYAATVLAQDPTSFYEFQGDGSDAQGGASAVMNGSVSYGAAGTGPFAGSKAAVFNGSGYLSVPGVSMYDQSFSISFWVNADTFQYDWIAGEGTSASVGQEWESGANLGTNGNACDAYFGETDTCGTMSSGTWQQVVFTYDTDTQRSAVYVDGQLMGADTVGSGLQATGPMEIGALPNYGSAQYSYASIAYWAMWSDTVLSPSQVQAQYAAAQSN